jgi:hypothetical protein
VAVGFEDIEDSLRLLRATFVDEIEPLIDQGPGGSYAVATLVAVGHEELSRVRFGSPRGELSFAETLPKSWRPVAPSLYGALRDGLAHGYGAQTILYDGRRVVLGISTGPLPNPHRLTVGPFSEGAADVDAVLLGARRLVADLRTEFDRFEAELQRDGELRDAFLDRWVKGRERVVHDPTEAQAWRELTSQRGR